MLGCSTICPRCQHQFACCTPANRALQSLSGGGLISAPTISCTSPQVSPSAPLAFVLPPLVPYAAAVPPPAPPPDTEIHRLAGAVKALRLSGWYHEGISYQQSGELLKNKAAGTFLVRDSSDPRFLYALSVQTDRGPTSVRIHYVDGFFRLDAQPHLQPVMPVFPGVVELVQHYVHRHAHSVAHDTQVWVDPNGKWYSAIRLDRPLRRCETAPPTLKHLSRLAVHRALDASKRARPRPLAAGGPALQLPPSLAQYLADYPYSI